MLFAMSEVVFEVIALGFEGVVVLILDLPPCTACRCERRDVIARKAMIGYPGIGEQNFSILCG
jgi:hypothetical protein